eukprot:6198022-Pleurochrysis_carterae.AAC.1
MRRKRTGLAPNHASESQLFGAALSGSQILRLGMVMTPSSLYSSHGSFRNCCRTRRRQRCVLRYAPLSSRPRRCSPGARPRARASVCTGSCACACACDVERAAVTSGRKTDTAAAVAALLLVSSCYVI